MNILSLILMPLLPAPQTGTPQGDTLGNNVSEIPVTGGRASPHGPCPLWHF